MSKNKYENKMSSLGSTNNQGRASGYKTIE